MAKGDRTEDQQREQAQVVKTHETEGAAQAQDNVGALGAGGAGVVSRMAAVRPGGSAFTVPAVLDTTKFPNAQARNVAINSSYQQFDMALTAYLGQPFCANWATFGKHASAHVGHEMAAADESLRLLDSLGNVDQLVDDIETFHPIRAKAEIQHLYEALSHLNVLINKPGIVGQSMGMAMGLLSDTIVEMRTAVGSASGGWSKFKAAVKTIAGILPHMRNEIVVMKAELADGNQKIYDNIAPCLQEFLAGVVSAPNGIPATLSIPSDKDGFMTAAFHHYVEARRLVNQLQEPAHANDAGLLDRRLQEIELANLTLVTHEQMVAQPDYDAMQPQMKALAGRMSLVDPTGVHELLPNGGNWGNFYERLGYDPATAPADPHKIDPNHLPKQLPKTDPRFKGSIGDYFDENAQETRLQQAPIQPAP